MGDRRGAYWILVGRPEGGRPFGRPGCRWEVKIKMDLQGMGRGGLWVAIACECGNESSGSIKSREFLE
jgi:hypothetical protein